MDAQRLNSIATGSVRGSGSVSALGDIVGGDKITLQFGDVDASQREREALSGYLQGLLRSCDVLDMPEERDDHEFHVVHVNDVYIEPCVAERIAYGEDEFSRVYRVPIERLAESSVEIVGDWELVPMSATEFVGWQQRSIVLGASGSGKSTFARYLIMRACRALLDGIAPSAPLEEVLSEGRLPIRIDACAFADSPHFGVEAKNVWLYLRESLGMFAEAANPIQRALATGAALIVCDGLDRLDRGLKPIVTRAVSAFALVHDLNRCVITCLASDYESDRELALDHFVVTRLEPFARAQRDAFVRRYCAALRSRTPDRTFDEDAFVRTVAAPEFVGMVESPLLLTQVALLYSSSDRDAIPNNRPQLFESAVKLLVKRWRASTPALRSLLDRLGIVAPELLPFETIIQEIAFITYSRSGAQPVAMADVLVTVQQHFGGDWGKAQEFCDYIVRRAGLLVERDGRYAFAHPAYHEFLAAQHLATQRDFVARIADLCIADVNRWRDVFVMAAAIAGADVGMLAISALCYDGPPSNGGFVDGPGASRWQAILVAAEAAAALGQTAIRQRPERALVTERLIRWLAFLVEFPLIGAFDRIKAGRLLAALGDPRLGVSTQNPAFVNIPPGSVSLTPPRVEGDDVGASYTLDVPYSYAIGRFPVTQAQYAFFVSATPEQQVPSGVTGYAWNEKDRTPPRDRLNQPVVLVSWFDAKAYCAWLTTVLSAEGTLPTGYVVRLPTDVEWSKAAQGGHELPDGTSNAQPTRRFPWGDELLPDRANLRHLDPDGIAETTAVGAFPDGASPYGLLDMAGNAMEWVQTSWGSTQENQPGFLAPYDPGDGRDADDAPGHRLARGGSWLFPEGEVQCACRLNPEMRYPDVGFRVAIGPTLNSRYSVSAVLDKELP
ncbi:MAG TPA: SUMF1/EgtB/PvdO family nonheme iron enzyme [Gemmatimonadaceae bacterium]|nr:SUMF1/EgtB/PvdO family nonheme iron enzyme [Gemmatimonadaceae bacterium]